MLMLLDVGFAGWRYDLPIPPPPPTHTQGSGSCCNIHNNNAKMINALLGGLSANRQETAAEKRGVRGGGGAGQTGLVTKQISLG